jgi:hypothetical protein
MPKISQDGARRLSKVARRVEQTPRTRIKPPAPPRISTTAKYAIVTTAIGARSGSSPGKGVVDLQVVTYANDDTATYASMGVSVPCYHGGSPGIATGRLVIVDVIDGRYHVVVDYC